MCIISGSSEGAHICIDTFEMIPPLTDKDPVEVMNDIKKLELESKGIGGDIYYGYRSDLLEFVSHNVKAFGGKLQ